MSGHLLTLRELGDEGIADVLALTDRFVEVGRRPIPKVPALRGRTVATLFFEESTRTRLAFEIAAKRLSADVLSFAAASSSLAKGESLRDTFETVQAMGIDAAVIRHRSAGVPEQMARWADDRVAVVNGGDGWHAHPTQGLQDAYTLWRHFSPLRDGHRPESATSNGASPADTPADVPTLWGRRIGIVGDIVHSRVARSDIEAYTALGAGVVLVAPPTLLPAAPREWIDGWLPADAAARVDISHSLDDVLGQLDVVGLLRCQRERMADGLIGSVPEYAARYGLTAQRAERLRPGAVITHPGPVNRGIEIAGAVLEDLAANRVLITRQVSHGVATRMAVLFGLVGSSTALPGAGPLADLTPAAEPISSSDRTAVPDNSHRQSSASTAERQVIEHETDG
ncbi:aspartate carbamoyltransferase catalytic subunit [Candidatus Poriferisodalis sp.]|uniref:aspartate carbamoyltransferase catalytic subunit n=1 Tax=Candidatus Poriferisodalis sp. TaxID=3101277 RepID=UPI003B015D6A